MRTQYGTWVKVLKPGPSQSSIYINGLMFVNDSVGYSVGGQTFHTTYNGGRSWNYAEFPCTYGQLTIGWFNQTGVAIVAATPVYSNQPGPIFSRTALAKLGYRLHHYKSLGFLTTLKSLMAIYSDTIPSFTSTDFGATWQYSSALESFRGIFGRITRADSLHAFAHGSAGKIAYTSNGGITWANRSIPNSGLVARRN